MIKNGEDSYSTFMIVSMKQSKDLMKAQNRKKEKE